MIKDDLALRTTYIQKNLIADKQIEQLHSAEITSTAKENDLEENRNILLEDEDLDFPEGGFKAWSVVFGAFSSMCATFGTVNSCGFLQSWLTTHQLSHLSESQVSWIFSIYLFLFFLGGVQVGPIFDTYGLQFVLIPGCVGFVLSVFILSICEEYYQFILGFGVLGGISATLVFTPSVAVVGHWFYKGRALATGLAATGGAVGGTVFPLAMIKMIDTLGFGWTVRVIGFVILALCICAILTLRTRIPLNKSAGAQIDLSAFKDIRFTLATVGIFLIEWALFVPITYISTYALSQGLDSTLSYQLLPILNAGSIIGRGLPGYLADKFGRYNVMTLTATLCAFFTLTIWLTAGENTAAIIAFAVLFGFWSGTAICLTPVCISQICKTEDYGKRYGTCYFFVSFGTLSGLPIAGQILRTNDGNYQGLIIFCGVIYFAGALTFLAARLVGTGFKLKVIY